METLVQNAVRSPGSLTFASRTSLCNAAGVSFRLFTWTRTQATQSLGGRVLAQSTMLLHNFDGRKFKFDTEICTIDYTLDKIIECAKHNQFCKMIKNLDCADFCSQLIQTFGLSQPSKHTKDAKDREWTRFQSRKCKSALFCIFQCWESENSIMHRPVQVRYWAIVRLEFEHPNPLFRGFAVRSNEPRTSSTTLWGFVLTNVRERTFET